MKSSRHSASIATIGLLLCCAVFRHGVAAPTPEGGDTRPPAPAGAYRPLADTPAAPSAFEVRTPLLAVAAAGSRIVAVGLRGHIVYSDDGGRTRVQAKVPVETDLVSVCFPTPTVGWAVGHGGIVLATADGGKSWTKRFSGRELDELTDRHSQGKPDESEQSIPSLLDVWFESPMKGTIVGTFGTVFRTEDGGKTWSSQMDRVDNPEKLHFYAVKGDADFLYIAGEKGNVWRFDRESKRWVSLPTGYSGTLFGLVVDGPKVVAFGMRGSAFLSENGGKSWTAVATQRAAGITAGLRLANGDIVLADQSGGLVRSRDGGRTFTSFGGDTHIPVFGLTQVEGGRVFSVGVLGVTAQMSH
ncbi:Uncharacterized protein VAR608DRAFT_2836 [Variovorax sp. HW608]|uniref:WD40/YVTN/BNR-like repeat-containing protein n=1 Tax=Variovorax sp. HW608 TaxID=1034889 RepID=UPI00081F765A|nr:YCF48-related protein [Variovorax sp. HW608]SCK32488.1 Uncharacterized protein VAR608DRAFT_2836 [Variovorax sp. HW608]